MNATLQADDYRGLPFWSWNGKLCETELRRQIRIFREMGYAGFFMHSRSGLNTEYLGREWFDSVRACIDEARIQGLEAWLYDEDRYASGSGGGERHCSAAAGWKKGIACKAENRFCVFMSGSTDRTPGTTGAASPT